MQTKTKFDFEVIESGRRKRAKGTINDRRGRDKFGRRAELA
jgi:hypothetical protein